MFKFNSEKPTSMCRELVQRAKPKSANDVEHANVSQTMALLAYRLRAWEIRGPGELLGRSAFKHILIKANQHSCLKKRSWNRKLDSSKEMH